MNFGQKICHLSVYLVQLCIKLYVSYTLMKLETNKQKNPTKLLFKVSKEMAIHSSTLAWKIPWTEKPGRLHTVHGVTKSQTRLCDFTFNFHFSIYKKCRILPLICGLFRSVLLKFSKYLEIF